MVFRFGSCSFLASLVFDSFFEKEWLKKRGFVVGYFRFRNSMSSSGVVAMYSNPFSTSCLASVAFVAVLHIHSSSFMLISCV